MTKSLEQIRKRICTRSFFFWTVNLVFMAVSVLHAGMFFGITGNQGTTTFITVKGKQVPMVVPGHDLPGMTQWLGFAVSFFLDLVTIILMQAMLESRYRGEENRARQFLFFIVLCCGTSTFANLAISLNDFDAKTMLPHAPFLIQAAAPYVLASFPLFVIMMSIAAEMIINVRPLDSLDEKEYEADEQKRVNILQIRNNYLQIQANEELRALTIRTQMKANKQLRKGNLPNGFRWFWEKPIETSVIITEIAEQFKALYEPQIEQLKRRLEEGQTATYTDENSAGIPDVLPPSKPEQNTTNNADNQPDNEARIEANIPEQNVKNNAQNTGENEIDPALLTLAKNYPRVASEWLAVNRKTASIDEVMEVTGQSKRRLNKANFKRSTRNAELVLISAVIEWLKSAPLPSKAETKTEDQTDLSRVDSLLQSALHQRYTDQPKQTVNLDEYPELLV